MEEGAGKIAVCSGLVVDRFLFAIGDVPAAAFEDDPGGLDEPADAAMTFRAARQRPGRKTLHPVETEAAFFAPIGIEWHRTSPLQPGGNPCEGCS